LRARDIQQMGKGGARGDRATSADRHRIGVSRDGGGSAKGHGPPGAAGERRQTGYRSVRGPGPRARPRRRRARRTPRADAPPAPSA
jgi:hypothetical protein